jgi:DNA-directed RNA polymerase subunit M/transcription elongation factor TFIIS
MPRKDETIKCPKCQSTHVYPLKLDKNTKRRSAGNKTVLICVKCAHTFPPGK